MADLVVRVSSGRQWESIVRALKAGIVRLPARQQADVRRFLATHDRDADYVGGDA